MTRRGHIILWWIVLGVFAAWSVWLGAEAWRHAHPRVISLPQLHLAPLVVEAEVPEAKGDATVVTVKSVIKGNELLQANPAIPAPGGRKIIVKHLVESQGWQGPGTYLLPLFPVEPQRGELSHFNVAPIPISPGFFYAKPQQVQRPVYWMSDAIRGQVESWLKTS